MNKEINNKPKFKFVTENEIKNEVTKKDLELNKNKKEHNGFKNMRIFSETKAISKISYNLSYKANKFILNNLEKKKKNKYNINFKESTEDYKNTRKKFFKKAFELLENSQIEKMKCMKL
jgi:peptidyl-tRNA hydrolase